MKDRKSVDVEDVYKYGMIEVDVLSQNELEATRSLYIMLKLKTLASDVLNNLTCFKVEVRELGTFQHVEKLIRMGVPKSLMQLTYFCLFE